MDIFVSFSCIALLTAAVGCDDDTLAARATPTRTVTPTPTATPTEAPPCERAGVICTVAGTGKAGFDGDGRPALQTSLYWPFQVIFDRGGRPLILDWNNLRLRRIGEDGRVTTVMGLDIEAAPVDGALAKDTSLHHASDVKYDSGWRLYVAGNHVPLVFRVGTDDRVAIIAGIDEVGYDGDGGPARNAKLNVPFGILPLADGSYYVSDIEAHVIRFVDANGIIRTVAGTGTPGYDGDGGPATAAHLNEPTHMRRDGAGGVYFCDSKNHVVRRLRPDGVIETVAGSGFAGFSGDGGPAIEARFDTPYDLEFGSDGGLYVADAGNNRIRRIAADGTIGTVAGSGVAGFSGDEGDARQAQLRYPTGVAFAADGSMWIADTFNHRVRRVAGVLRGAGSG